MFGWEEKYCVENRYDGIGYSVTKNTETGSRVAEITIRKNTRPPLQLLCLWKIFLLDRDEIYKYEQLDLIIFGIFEDYLRYIIKRQDEKRWDHHLLYWNYYLPYLPFSEEDICDTKYFNIYWDDYINSVCESFIIKIVSLDRRRFGDL